MKAPLLVRDDEGLPRVMNAREVTRFLGRTYAIPARRNYTTRLFLPLHAVEASILEIAPRLKDVDPDTVVLTYRCGKRDGVAQVTLGAMLGIGRPTGP